MQRLDKIYDELPFGTMIRLKDDYPGTVREVSSLEVTADAVYIKFRDGTMINADRRNDLVEEVVA